ncbi:hypothetical protein PG993_004237 [Apiospora rasikravindrae]|uniref:DUF7924 domain-containing protein n=1 Tax=Apiospora rasikravindrae TaxID=990691 RepID=A0ABR1TC85_9PEZI
MVPQAPSSQYAPDTAEAGSDPVPTATSSRKQRLVELPTYRGDYLQKNNIYFVLPEDAETALPDWAAKDCDEILSAPSPARRHSAMNVEGLQDMQRGDADVREVDILRWLEKNLFPDDDDIRKLGLRLIGCMPFKRAYLPGGDAPNPVSEPVPDLTYGYTLKETCVPFTSTQLTASKAMDPERGKPGSSDLAFPFLIVEGKVDAPKKSCLKVGENQCLGASATCVSIINRLNSLLLLKCEGAKKVRSAIFSIAVNQDVARLYVSWMGDDDIYYMKRICLVDLWLEAGRRDLARYAANIMDWGSGTRFKDIQRALDIISDEGRKTSSVKAKARDITPDTHSSKRQRR